MCMLFTTYVCAVLTGFGIQSRCIHFTYHWRLVSESSWERVRRCRQLDTVLPPWLLAFSILFLCQPESRQQMQNVPKLVTKHRQGKVIMFVVNVINGRQNDCDVWIEGCLSQWHTDMLYITSLFRLTVKLSVEARSRIQAGGQCTLYR